MSKNTPKNKPKTIGSKISVREVKTPSDNQDIPLASIIQASTDKIIDELSDIVLHNLENTGTITGTIVNNLNVLKDVLNNTNTATLKIFEKIDERLIGILSVLYNDKVDNNTRTQSLISKRASDKTLLGYAKSNDETLCLLYDLIDEKLTNKLSAVTSPSATAAAPSATAATTSNKLDITIKGVNVDSETIQGLLNLISSSNSSSGKTKKVDTGGIVEIINSLSKINFENLGKIDGNSLENLPKIGEALGKFIININKVEANKENTTAIKNIGETIASLTSAIGIDDKGYKNITKFIKKLIRLTEKPNRMLMRLGLSNRGLLYQLFNNIKNLGELSKEQRKSLPVISSFINDIVSLSNNVKAKDIKSFNKKVDLLHSVISYDFIALLDAVVDIGIRYERLPGYIKLIKNILEGLDNLHSKVKLENIVKLYAIVSLFNSVLTKLNDVESNLNALDKKLNTERISIFFDDINSIKVDNTNIVELIKTSVLLSSLNTGLIIAGALATPAAVSLVALTGELYIIKLITDNITFANIEDFNNNLDGLYDFAKKIAIINTSLSVAGVLAVPALIGLVTVAGELYIIKFITDNITFANVEDFNNNLDGIYNFAKKIAIINVALAIAGVLAIPALIGLVAVVGELYIIKVILNVINSIEISDEEFDKLKSVATIIAVCSGLLILASFLGKYVVSEFPNIILFSISLGVFMLLTIGVINLGTRGMDDASINAKEFAKLVAYSGGIMMIGALFMMIPGLFVNSILFAVSLGIFIAAIGGAFGLATKWLKDAIDTAQQFVILVTIISAVLMIGGALMMIPGMLEGVLYFAAITAAFLVAMVGVLSLLTLIKKDKLAQAMAALKVIVITLAAMAIIYGITAYVSKLADPLEVIETLGTMLVAIVAIGAIVYILGKIMTSPQGAAVIGLGEAALAGIVCIIWLIGQAMISIADGINALANMKKLDGDLMMDNLETFIDLSWRLVKSHLAIPGTQILIASACTNIALLSGAIYSMAVAVQKMANLTAPLFDENGKIIGERQLTSSDFTDAAENVKEIITVLGSAIIETYESNKEIFSAGGLGDFLRMDTPFARVCRSSARMGDMIAKIAKGVKEYADLKIPEYDDNGKFRGYKRLNETHFRSAANNVKIIIETLGGAIIDTYKGNEEMFNWRLIGDNPFVMVVKSTSKMGDMINSIATAVRDYANLRINKYDKNGKVIGTEPMGERHFKDAAKNIAIIITTLGNAINDTYERNPKLFTDPSLWHTDADKTPCGMVVKALSGAGELISSAAKAIQDVNDLPLINELADENKQKEIKAKIGAVVGILASAIYEEAVDETGKPKEAYMDEGWNIGWGLVKGSSGDGSASPVGRVIRALTGADKLIMGAVGVAERIDKLIQKIGKDRLDNIPPFITTLLESFIKPIREAGESEAFKDEGWSVAWGLVKGGAGDYKDTPVYAVVTAVGGATKIITGIVTEVERIMALQEKYKKTSATIKGIIKNYISALPDGILAATINSQDEETQKFWKKPNDTLKPIKDAYETMTNVVNIVVESYTKTLNYVNQNTKRLNIGEYIGRITGYIVNAFINIRVKNSEELKKIKSSFDEYKNIIDVIVDTYSGAYKKLASISDTDITKTVDAINISLQQAIEGIRNTISKSPQDLTNFEKETKLVSSYVKTINSVSIIKVSKLTSLANALTDMSTNLGSLDKLTDVLANKVSIVLSNLTKRLESSAKVINKAETIQKSRHAKITAALKEMKLLMDKPLNISVTHKAEVADENPTIPGGDVDTSTNTSDRSNSNNSNSNNTSLRSSDIPATSNEFIKKINSDNDFKENVFKAIKSLCGERKLSRNIVENPNRR